MDAGSGHGSAAKGSATDLDVAGSGLVGCCFSIPSSFFTMCSSLPCLSVLIIIYVRNTLFAQCTIHHWLPLVTSNNYCLTLVRDYIS